MWNDIDMWADMHMYRLSWKILHTCTGTTRDVCQASAHPTSLVFMPFQQKNLKGYFFLFFLVNILLDPDAEPDPATGWAVARSAFGQLPLVWKLWPFLVKNVLATVTHALTTSRLDYCNVLYMEPPFEMSWIGNFSLHKMQWIPIRLSMWLQFYVSYTGCLLFSVPNSSTCFDL